MVREADLLKKEGLSEEDFEQIETQKWKSSMIDNNHTFECCPICYVDYEYGEELKVLGCSHAYHTACVKEWLKKNPLCPVCKEKVEPKK